MKYTQKPVSIFPNNVLLQAHEILNYIAISHEYQIFKCVENVRILSLLCPWLRHVVVSGTLFSFAHHIVTNISSSPFHIGSFFALSIMWLSYINKAVVMKICYLLPRKKLLRVTFFVKWSYLLHGKTLNCLNSRIRHTRISVFALNWDLVTSILCIKSRAIHRNFAYFARICTVWSSPGRLRRRWLQLPSSVIPPWPCQVVWERLILESPFPVTSFDMTPNTEISYVYLDCPTSIQQPCSDEYS